MNAQQLDKLEHQARAALDQTRGEWRVEWFNGKAYLKDLRSTLASFTLMSGEAAHLAALCYPAAVLDLVADARRGLGALELQAEVEHLQAELGKLQRDYNALCLEVDPESAVDGEDFGA
ncbi:MAG: hypothetical protein IT318_24720 [Anaerolineales bacterium]|nr:hypothetical protein [Anaerolineales bacterium]